MSRVLQAHRRHRLIQLAVVCTGLILLAGLVGLSNRPSDEEPSRNGLVFEAFADQREELGLIMVTTPDTAYHMVKDGEGWILTERGGYPVRPDRMNDLIRAIETMEYGPRKTSDPEKLDRLGVGDPTQGGTGAIVELGDGSGAVFAEAVFGTRRDTQYMRLMDEVQAFEVSERLPPLHRMDPWLDLKPLTLTAADIQSTTVIRPGMGYFTLARSNDTFVLVDPPTGRALIADYLATTVATAAMTLSPRDVQRRGARTEEAQAVHDITLMDGQRVILSAYEVDGRYWISYETSIASTLGDSLSDWLFEVSEIEWSNLTADLDDFSVAVQDDL